MNAIANLPREPFLVRRAYCTAVKKPLPDLVTRLSNWREHEFEHLEALDLSGCAIDNLGFAAPLASLQELNVSGTNPLRPWLMEAPVRVLVDTDPVFTQIRHLDEPAARRRAEQHTCFLTFGENFGRAGW